MVSRMIFMRIPMLTVSKARERSLLLYYWFAFYSVPFVCGHVWHSNLANGDSKDMGR